MDISTTDPSRPELILSVTGSSGRDEIGYFFDACASIFRGELEERRENDVYSVDLAGVQLGPLVMSKVLMTGGRYQYRRDSRLIAASGLDLILVQIITEGSDTRLVNGQEVRSRPGYVFVADLTRAIRTATEHCGNFSFVLPRAAFGMREAELDRLHDLFLPAESLAARLIVNHIRLLWRERHEIGPAEISGLTTATAGLIAGFLQGGDVASGPERLSGSKYLQICHYIERNLSNVELDPDELSRRFNLSRATLYRLFSTTDGVANYIRERRLRQAFRRLVSSDAPRVSAVGFSSGFANTSTFIRAFRSRYGVTPGEAIESAASRSAHSFTNALTPESSLLRSWIEQADRTSLA